MVLYAVVTASHGKDREMLVSWLKNENLWSIVSAQEIAFLTAKSPTEQQQINATWRIEALTLLLWSLDKVQNADNLGQMSRVEALKAACPFLLKSTTDFIANAKLRDEDDIDELSESIYDSHWEVPACSEPQEPALLAASEFLDLLTACQFLIALDNEGS